MEKVNTPNRNFIHEEIDPILEKHQKKITEKQVFEIIKQDYFCL